MRRGRAGPGPVLATTIVRFAFVLLCAAGIALSKWVSPTSLLLWTAISYLVLLVVDTTYLIRWVSPETGGTRG